MLALRTVRTLVGLPLSAASALAGTVVRVGAGTALRVGGGALDAGVGAATTLRGLLAGIPDPSPYDADGPGRPPAATVRVDPRVATPPARAVDELPVDDDAEEQDNVFASWEAGDADDAAGPDVPEHAVDLPIDRWDQLAPATLRPRLTPLTLEELLVLQEWEREHAHRPQILTMLDTRISRLRPEGP